jgi:hypothetical protein
MLTSRIRQREIVLTAPEFYCPNCHTHKYYEVKLVSDVSIVCAIPLFETNNHTHLVECQTCKNGFDPEILKPNNQSLFKLVAATRSQLLNCTSPGSLKVRLMSDGLGEEFVNKLISLAQN